MERPIHRDRDGMMDVIEYVYVMMEIIENE
jgi:hypothetical protein